MLFQTRDHLQNKSAKNILFTCKDERKVIRISEAEHYINGIGSWLIQAVDNKECLFNQMWTYWVIELNERLYLQHNIILHCASD